MNPHGLFAQQILNEPRPPPKPPLGIPITFANYAYNLLDRVPDKVLELGAGISSNNIGSVSINTGRREFMDGIRRQMKETTLRLLVAVACSIDIWLLYTICGRGF